MTKQEASQNAGIITNMIVSTALAENRVTPRNTAAWRLYIKLISNTLNQLEKHVNFVERADRNPVDWKGVEKP